MRAFLRLTAVAVALSGAVACGSSSNTTATTPTVAASTTQTFTGTISTGNGHTYPFVASVGTITLTLTSVVPDTTIPLGISIGTWSGISCTVGTGLFNDAAFQGTTITATSTSIGTFCARVYDGAGQIAQPTTYVITVVHP